MEKYNFMECNSAGNCFFVRYSIKNGVCTIEIYTDEECEDIVESYSVNVTLTRKMDKETETAFIEQMISDSVKRTIEDY